MAEPNDPTISVRLETDEQGNPAVIERGAERHYQVVFEVENAPSDTYAATIELDQSSHYDPVRILRPDDDGKFRLKTTTFGDYPVIIKLHREKAADLILKEGVARALRRNRETMPANPQIDEALAYIAEH